MECFGGKHRPEQKCIPCHQFSSVAQSCPTLCNPMNRSTPGLPVHHHLLEFTQTHVHRVGDAIQPSRPRSSPSPPAPSPSQHRPFTVSQLYAWGGQSIGVWASASFLPKKSQGWSPSEWLASCKPLVRRTLSASWYITLFYVCFCLMASYLI